MKRIETVPALLLLMAACLLLEPSAVVASSTGDACQGCHFSYFGSPEEGCVSCHQGALHYRHVYQDPGDEHFPNCGSPPDKCKCCHGDPPDYVSPPVVANRCSACHGVTESDIVAYHNCSAHYDPDPETHCLDCHGLTGIPTSRIVDEQDANDNCNDVLDNDADCGTDNEDTGCTGAAEAEICDDGLDNDFDRLIDGEDLDCCGDGVTDPPETCDDGNTIGCDGCSETCEAETCGDGEVCPALGEDCDDGNVARCDGCSDSCRVEYCGDGMICPALGEECEVDDDCGNGYSCDDTCTCRDELVLPCGASTTGQGPGADRTRLNIVLLLVPLLLFLLVRKGFRCDRKRIPVDVAKAWHRRRTRGI